MEETTPSGRHGIIPQPQEKGGRMTLRGLTLTEVLLALALAVIVGGSAVIPMNRTSRVGVEEKQILIAQNQVYTGLTGLEKELKGKNILSVLPGSGEDTVSMVVTEGTGFPVLESGFSPTAFRMAVTRPGVTDIPHPSPLALGFWDGNH
ncbi:hypothetical protein, partial [Thermus sp.]|uniref:hypothetical protein n=1 Tax=Thermus sp. TaxID=275 RepID=UPI00298ED664